MYHYPSACTTSLVVSSIFSCPSIVVSKPNDLKKALKEKNIRFAFTSEAAKIIAKKAYSKKYGARNLRRLIQTEVEDKMANLIIESRERTNLMFSLDAGENGEAAIALV